MKSNPTSSFRRRYPSSSTQQQRAQTQAAAARTSPRCRSTAESRHTPRAGPRTERLRQPRRIEKKQTRSFVRARPPRKRAGCRRRPGVHAHSAVLAGAQRPSRQAFSESQQSLSLEHAASSSAQPRPPAAAAAAVSAASTTTAIGRRRRGIFRARSQARWPRAMDYEAQVRKAGAAGLAGTHVLPETTCQCARSSFDPGRLVVDLWHSETTLVRR